MAFFRLFPETFRYSPESNKVVGVWWQHQQPNDVQGHIVKAAPYNKGGWWDVGVTSHMIIELARDLPGGPHLPRRPEGAHLRAA